MSTDARTEVLGRIRTALGPAPTLPEIPRAYHGAGTRGATGGDDAIERFCERAADYRAEVHRVTPGELSHAVTAACARHGVRRLAVSRAIDGRPGGVELVEDSPPLTPRELDTVDAVLTGSALAIAETGTVVLDSGPRSGRRALSLVPDRHFCVVEAAQVVPSVPDAIAALSEAAADGRPITFVSGPSATADIELERVEGVHGPRTLEIFVVAPAA